MDRLAYWFYRRVSALLCALPLATGFRLGWFLGTLGYYLAPPYRRLVLNNLRIAFGEEKTEKELRRIARRHFATLGANLFASMRLPALSRQEIESVVTVEGLENMDPQFDAGGGFVMVISHIGNWEMFAQLSPIAFRCKVGTIYQRLGNAFLDGEVRRDRARLGLELFERKEGFTGAAKFIREGGAVGVLIDQHAGDAGLWCPFFGRLASTTSLAATLALRTGGWMIPAAVYTDGIARWRCVILPRLKVDGASVDVLTNRINQVLEQQIRRQPEDWFWVHNRWKTPKPKFLLATYKRGVVLPEDLPAPAALKPFRILIRSSNWLGDAIMSIPAVRAIKRGRPDAHVTVSSPKKLADLWRTVAEVDEVIPLEPRDSVFCVGRILHPHQFDVAILFPNSLRSALEVWLAGIPRRVGYRGHFRHWLLNQIFVDKRKKLPAGLRHQVHHFLDLAEFVGAEITATDAVFPGREFQDSGNPLIRIGICAGAEYGAAKRWLPERFAEVMKTVSAKQECEWVLFGVDKDRLVGEEILREFTGKHRNLIGRTTLAQLMEELRGCDLLLTNDTGTMHLAAYLGIPTVSIFGSTEPALTGPLGRRHRVLRHHVECSPCFLRNCPIDFRCMKSIEATEVVAAIEGTLEPNRTNTVYSVS